MDEYLPCQAEADLMEAAYGHSFELCNAADGNGVLTFNIRIDILNCVLKISIPKEYPEEPIQFNLDGAITRAERKALTLDLNLFMCESESSPAGSLDLCQQATDMLRCLQQARKPDISEAPNWNSLLTRKDVSIARFLIYFHHIMSGTKRAFIYDCAKCLSLGGFSKVGYPGIVLVEGDKLDVIDFVNRVQRLRWKHMVVRGEEIEQLYPAAGEKIVEEIPLISEDSARQFVNTNRRFPSVFLGELADTSAAGAICQQYNCHDLYLTAMKIYNGNSADDDS